MHTKVCAQSTHFKVNVNFAMLVFGWVTVCGQVDHLGM